MGGVGLRWPSPGIWGVDGRLMATSEGLRSGGEPSGLLPPVPHPCGETLLTSPPQGDPPAPASRSASASGGITAPLLWAWCVQCSLCSPGLGQFPQSCGSPVVKSRWPSRSGSWGFPVPLSDPQAGKPHVGLRTFVRVGGLRWCRCPQFVGRPQQAQAVTAPRSSGASAAVSWRLLLLFSGVFLRRLSVAVQQLLVVSVLSQEMSPVLLLHRLEPEPLDPPSYGICSFSYLSLGNTWLCHIAT